MTDLSRLVGDAAVWAPLHRIAGTLDKSLPGIFAADYAERLEAARSRLCPALNDSATSFSSWKRAPARISTPGTRSLR